MTPLNSNPIKQLTRWHDQKVKEATTPPEDCQQRIDQFQRDLAEVEKMDGRLPDGWGFPGDKDPHAGSVHVPGLASLRKTSDGFNLGLMRGRLAYNGEVSWVSYQVNPSDDCVQVAEVHHHDSTHSMPYRENYTLHPGSHTLTNYERLASSGNEAFPSP